MATELFSIWGGFTGWRAQRGAGYDVTATLDGIVVHYCADDSRAVDRAFARACRRTVLRRVLPFLMPPPTTLSLRKKMTNTELKSFHNLLRTPRCFGEEKMRPIIFLDIDDVLAISREYTGRHVMTAFKSSDPDGWPELWEGLISAGARANLVALHREFWPQYVISSSWSNYLTREQMQAIFRRTGLDFVTQNLHKWWTTPKNTGPSRIDEIEKWIAKHGRRRQTILVLDDQDSGVSLRASSLDHQGLVVLCDPWVGFNVDKLASAQCLLRAQLVPKAPLMIRPLRQISDAEMAEVVRARTSRGSHEQLTLADAELEDEVRKIQARAGLRLPGTCSGSADDGS